jgi:hypothetical protein
MATNGVLMRLLRQRVHDRRELRLRYITFAMSSDIRTGPIAFRAAALERGGRTVAVSIRCLHFIHVTGPAL